MNAREQKECCVKHKLVGIKKMFPSQSENNGAIRLSEGPRFGDLSMSCIHMAKLVFQGEVDSVVIRRTKCFQVDCSVNYFPQVIVLDRGSFINCIYIYIHIDIKGKTMGRNSNWFDSFNNISAFGLLQIKN